MLPLAERQRFVKICALLASPSEGERANAALMASTLLTNNGLSWAEILGADKPKTAKPKQASDARKEAADLYEIARQRGIGLSSFEQDFLPDLANQSTPASDKQKRTLSQIAMKIERHSQESFV